MMDDDQLGSRLREQLDVELGDLRAQPGSRERLRRSMRKRRRTPWLRASILVPVAAALAIVALVLAIPALLDRDNAVPVVPAGPAPVSTSVDQPPMPSLTAEPQETAAPERTTTSKRPKPTTRQSATTRAEDPTARPTQDGTVAPTPSRASAKRSSDPAVTATEKESTTPATNSK
jgi:hypothetical protein